MSTDKPQVIPVVIEMLSPVHIGTGEQYEPGDYVIRDKNLNLVDRELFSQSVENSGQYEKFLKIASLTGEPAIFQQRGFMDEHSTPDMFYRTIPVSRELRGNYEKTHKGFAQDNAQNSKVINELGIDRLPYHALHNEPYLPGSSIKGAIKTAFYNEVATELNLRLRGREDPATTLFGLDSRDSVTQDPFRAISVSDLLLLPQDGSPSQCVIAKNIKSFSGENQKAGSIPVRMEVLQTYTSFLGQIRVDSELFRRETVKSSQLRRAKLDVKDFRACLLRVCNRHYLNRVFHKENAVFGASLPVLKELNFEKGFLLKVGKHSGAYAVTVAGSAQIKNIKSREFMQMQTTTWSVDDSPMGYAFCHLLDDGRYDSYMEEIENHRNQVYAQTQEKSSSIQRSTLVIKPEVPKAEPKDPLEIRLERFESHPDDQFAIELCDKFLDEMQGSPLQMKCATLLKNYWSIGKGDKKKRDKLWFKVKKDSQIARVTKVKQILG
jgi:CRISPR-associated protein Csm5